MRALTETDKYLSTLETVEEVKEEDSMKDVLGKVVETFSSMESAVRDLEVVITNLNLSTADEEEVEVEVEEKSEEE